RWIAEYYPVEEIVELLPDTAAASHTADAAGPDGQAPTEPGRARVLMRYADPAWLVRLVLGLGGGARIVEPRELAAEVTRGAARALAPADAVRGAGGGAR